jgi:O-methyltransferase
MWRQRVGDLIERAGYTVRRLPTPETLAVTHPDLESAFHEVYRACVPNTMTTVEGMYGLWQSVRHLVRHGIAGDVVECGVWRGGSSQLAALAFTQAGDADRRFWLYDTFSGMSAPTERDRSAEGAATDLWTSLQGFRRERFLAEASLEVVKATMRSTGVEPERVTFVEGKVEDTIPATAPERIALLRLDTDWYESTRHELEHLWPRLSPGGVLIVDDYGHWAGAREAVDEFFAGRDDAPMLTRLDFTERIAIKPG